MKSALWGYLSFSSSKRRIENGLKSLMSESGGGGDLSREGLGWGGGEVVWSGDFLIIFLKLCCLLTFISILLISVGTNLFFLIIVLLYVLTK